MAESQKINRLLSFLSQEERDQFLAELLDMADKSRDANNLELINECIDDWEDIAELNSIPGLKIHAWEQFNKLKTTGRIN